MGFGSKKLIGSGTDVERVLVAIQGLRAFMEDRESVLESQAAIYSESFIEYGLLALGSGMLLGSQNPEQAIEQLQDDLFADLGERYEHDVLDIVKELHRGAVYNVETTRTPITAKDHKALLTVVLAMAGLLAREQGNELELMLDYIQVSLLGRAAEGVEDF